MSGYQNGFRLIRESGQCGGKAKNSLQRLSDQSPQYPVFQAGWLSIGSSQASAEERPLSFKVKTFWISKNPKRFGDLTRKL